MIYFSLMTTLRVKSMSAVLQSEIEAIFVLFVCIFSCEFFFFAAKQAVLGSSIICNLVN